MKKETKIKKETETKKEVVTRYAPSPTGHLHIGGARTALFAYVFAKHYKGKFIIRIEDTDFARNIEKGIESQIDGLKWLGIEADNSPLKENELGPYKQSERLHIYKKYLDILLEKGLAYKCYCTSEELENSREKQKEKGIIAPQYDGTCLKNPKKERKEFTIRIKMPLDEDFSWDDGVRGKISVHSSKMGDWILQKQNGIPTYSFANVIDDHLMNITHVHRGEEHIPNTPKQIHLYKIFGWEIPKFYHLTLITGKDGKKLSKRDESLIQFIETFKQKGFLSEAIFNYLTLLGWTPKESEKEIFSKEEIIKYFDSTRFSKSSSFFNFDKLIWTNNFYIKRLEEKKLFDFLIPFVEEEFKNFSFSKEKIIQIFNLFQKQLQFGEQIKDLIKVFIKEDVKEIYEASEIDLKLFELFERKLLKLNKFNHEEIKKIIQETSKELNLTGKNLLFPLRMKITGETRGPEIAKIIEIFGKEKTLKNLKKT